MDTRTAVERLNISDCAPYPFWHIMYEDFFYGRIAETPRGWHAYINSYDFGDFPTLDRAKQAVIRYFSGFDIDPGD